MSIISRRGFIKKAVILSAFTTASATVFFMKNYTAAAVEKSSPLLLAAPYLGKPTHSSITINLVAGEKDITCYLSFKKFNDSADEPWQQTKVFSIDALDPAEIVLKPLLSGTLYQYQVYAYLKNDTDIQLVSENNFRNQRKESAPFSFAVISDSHIAPFYKERLEILSEISDSILSRKTEFLLMLGDNIQTFTSHGGPMLKERFGPILYSALRRGLSELPSSVPVFAVNGNWEGENGWHFIREQTLARQARMAWIPNPGPGTYPEGGGENEDYYGFTWGDVLCLVLNVTGYTPSDHALQSPKGRADDWTLGDKQKSWLFQQLSKSKARWKLLFVHHTVGGNGGDEVNSRYGRGGGRAAKTGEQAIIHKWMRQFGVQALFYGHDHVFTDIPVDGIHYICVGSAGAPWKFPESVTGYRKFWTSSGYTWVDVHKDKLKISFIKPDVLQAGGKVLHSFTIL